MNEKQRASLEMYLQKKFPEIKRLRVQTSQVNNEMYIQGDDIIDKRFAIWREADNYTQEHFGWTTDWREPVSFSKL